MKPTRLPALKRVYSEVVRGTSLIKLNGRFIYIRHPRPTESAELESLYDDFLNQAVESGIPTNEEREKYLIENNLWSPDKDQEISNWKDFLSRLRQTKANVVLKRDIDSINAQMEEGEGEVRRLENEKRQVLGATAETFASRKFHDSLVFTSFFSDSETKVPLFSALEFDSMTDTESDQYLRIYLDSSSHFADLNLKKIALQPFFLNSFYLCEDDVFKLYGKPVVELTIHQMNLFAHGRYFKALLRDYGGEPTQEMLEDPDKFVEQVGQKRNAEKMLPNDPNKVQSIVGMSKADRRRAGIDDSEVIDMSKFVGKSMEEIGRELHG